MPGIRAITAAIVQTSFSIVAGSGFEPLATVYEAVEMPLLYPAMWRPKPVSSFAASTALATMVDFPLEQKVGYEPTYG